jgi:hypothetical protein
MGEIINIARSEPRIWVCGCGCSTFELVENGTARCAACGDNADVDGSGWLKTEAESHLDPGETFRDVQANGCIDFARKRVANAAREENAALIVVGFRDGTVTAWSEAETKKQMKWVRRKLRIASDLFKRKDR